MRPVVAILLYLAAVLVGGALLAPWAWHAMQWAGSTVEGLKSWADAPFHRYVSRSFLVVALVGLWPFLRALGARTFRDAGFAKSPDAPRRLLVGLAIGLSSLAFVAIFGLLCGTRSLHLSFTPGQWASHFFNASLSAVLVALFEELFFRGAVFGALRRSLPLLAAVALSSAVYALLHFFQRAESAGAVEWTSGLALLPRMLRGFGAVGELVPAFPNLLLAGAILALLFAATGNLWMSIGVHAGWVFLQKTHALVTVPAAGATGGFWGTGRLVDGWPSFIVLLSVVTAVWIRCFRQKGGTPASEDSALR